MRDNGVQRSGERWWVTATASQLTGRLGVGFKVCLVTLLVGLLCGCRSVEVVQVHHTDTVRIERLRVDSVMNRDSVYVTVVSRGDTVYVTKTVYVERYRERLVRDTVYEHSVDTVLVDAPKSGVTVWERMGGFAADVKSLVVWLVVLAGVLLLARFLRR